LKLTAEARPHYAGQFPAPATAEVASDQGHAVSGSPTKERYRVLLVSSHPVQYAAPLFRLMARHPRLDILVAYCSLQGAEPGIDPEFKVEVAWDIPLLEGYPWVRVPNRSPWPSLDRFTGLVNPGL